MRNPKTNLQVLKNRTQLQKKQTFHSDDNTKQVCPRKTVFLSPQSCLSGLLQDERLQPKKQPNASSTWKVALVELRSSSKQVLPFFALPVDLCIYVVARALLSEPLWEDMPRCEHTGAAQRWRQRRIRQWLRQGRMTRRQGPGQVQPPLTETVDGQD